MPRRALAFAAAAVCAFFAQAAFGVPAGAQNANQTIAGARIAAVAEGVARGLVSGGDRTIAPAYGIADQQVPEGAVALAPAGAPFVSPSYASVAVAISVNGRLARTVVAGYRITTYVRTAVGRTISRPTRCSRRTTSRSRASPRTAVPSSRPKR